MIRGPRLTMRPVPGGGRRPVAGFTVAETLVSLLLTLLLVHVAWSVTASQRAAAARLVHRSGTLDAERAVWWVLTEETGPGLAGRDWEVARAGVLRVRAFRGGGATCPEVAVAEGWVAVRYRGWRVPDPTKDSVLYVDAGGRRGVAELVERTRGDVPCELREGEHGEWLRLGAPPAARPVVVRVFETGSYHLEDRAFRYLRGRAGRQPLTAEVLDRAGTALHPAADGARLGFRGAGWPGLRPAAAPAADTGWIRPLRGW